MNFKIAVTALLLIVLIVLPAVLITSKLNTYKLDEPEYYSEVLEDVFCLRERCLSEAKSCDPETSVGCEEKTSDGEEKSRGFFWFNIPERSAAGFYSEAGYNSKHFFSQKFSCEDGFDANLADFESAFGVSVEEFTQNTIQYKNNLNDFERFQITDIQGVSLGASLSAGNSSESKSALNLTGVKVNNKRYSHVIRFGPKSSDGNNVSLDVENIPTEMKVFRDQSYFFLAANLQSDAFQRLRRGESRGSPVYLGNDVVEIQLNHLGESKQCEVIITALSHPPEDEINVTRNKATFMVLGQVRNAFGLTREIFHPKEKFIKFAKLATRPEELRFFNTLTQERLITQTPEASAQLEYIKTPTREALACTSTDKPCQNEWRSANAFLDNYQELTKQIVTRPVGKKISMEISRYNNRLYNSGVYLSKPKERGFTFLMDNERLTLEDVTVQSCHGQHCSNRTMGKVAKVREPTLDVQANLSLVDFYTVYDNSYFDASHLLRYEFSRLPEEGDYAYILGQRTKAKISYLKQGTSNYEGCRIPDRRKSESNQIISVLDAIRWCGLENERRVSVSLRVELPPLLCDSPNDCDIYKYAAKLPIKYNRKSGFSWSIYEPRSRFIALNGPQSGSIEQQDSDVEQVSFSEPKSPPDIYINGDNGRVRIFDAVTGISSYGQHLGLSNLTGANSNFINHLASYSEQDELNLAFDYEIQDLVNQSVEKQTLNWVGQESKNQAFKYYFGKSAQHSSSSLSVSIMEAKTGRILASADSNNLFAKDVQVSGDVSYLERLMPEKSNLRWLNHYHNATFWDVPGSVFKILTALSLEKVKAQCSDPQNVCPLSKNKELFLSSVGEITRQNAGTLNAMLRGDANGYYFKKNSCHYPDFDFGKGVKSSYDRNNGIYGQQVHNYTANRNLGMCVKSVATNGRLPTGNNWLTVNLNRSVNTWFAWTHEMITPATFEQGVDHRRHQYKDLLALDASSQIMQAIIPAANIIYQMGFDKSRNLITGEVVRRPEGAGNSPKSWILSPVTVKFQDIGDRAALRRFSIGLTGTSMTPLHIAAISASLVNNKVTYPSLMDSPMQALEPEENLEQNDTQNIDEASLERVNINSENRDFFQDINTDSIIQGMYYAANGSVGSTYTKTFQRGFECAQQRCICMYAKTGTAPLDSGTVSSQNSWITGWFFKNEKNKEGNGFRQCPMDSESFQNTTAEVYSFGCAAKRVASNYTGATGCGVVIKNIVKDGLEREVW